MAITPIKALLFAAGGSAAVAATAYVAGVLDPYLPTPPAAVAVAPPTEPVTPPAAAVTPPAATPPVASAPAAPDKPADAAAVPAPATPAVVPPSFDVVRVESNGSLVIAGKATPDSKVEVLAGSNLIGETKASAEGDFAIVLDNPLKPGDYQLVLRSTAPDNLIAMSVETAIVSVPETPGGQVLAMVEEPGKPAEVISVPKAEAPAAAEAAVTPPAMSETPAAPVAGAEPGATPPAAETPAAGEQAATTPPAAEMPAAPGETAPAAAAPATAEAPAEPKTGEQVAAAVPKQPATPAPAAAAAPVKVAVEAVEIEGSKIFVAGVADPGRHVRGYANEILLGDAKASPDGRFLIEAERDLAVGNYIIRIDALEADGTKVVARAAVPFEREPGEAIAAVAPPAAPAVETPPAVTEAPAAPAVEAPAVIAAAPAAPAVETPPVAAEAPAAPATETPAAMAEAPAAPATETPPAVSETPAAPATETPPAMAEAPAAPATDTPPATAEAPAAPVAETPPATAAAPAAPAAPAAVAEVPAAAAPAAPEEVAPAPAAPAEVAAAPAQPSAPTPPSDGVPEVVAPKLQSVDSAVIIRRGDTLWRISRRVYGMGVRYSTIYLANQAQIEDPNRIWPGQVFKVPEKSDDGQPADLTRMGKQITTVQ